MYGNIPAGKASPLAPSHLLVPRRAEPALYLAGYKNWARVMNKWWLSWGGGDSRLSLHSYRRKRQAGLCSCPCVSTGVSGDRELGRWYKTGWGCGGFVTPIKCTLMCKCGNNYLYFCTTGMVKKTRE